MTTVTLPRASVSTARRAVDGLAARLGIAPPSESRPGADLWERAVRHDPRPERAVLLRTGDGWVHPGPVTAWDSFTEMVRALGAPDGVPGQRLPDLSCLTAEAVDAEAGAWLLPAVAVRTARARAPRVPDAMSQADLAGLRDAHVVVTGTAWATPLVGLVLASLGARVVRVTDPRRVDPFPLRSRLAHGQHEVALDLTDGDDLEVMTRLVGRSDLLVDGYTPRVLSNVGLGDEILATEMPDVSVLRVAAFAHDDRPGYGTAAECRGGWVARHDPPRLARSSVADPVAGLLGALVAVDLLARKPAGSRARVSLEDAVGVLHDTEHDTERGSR